jgi:monofunctional biosynthetic peptidoglycan transglycosylase
MNTLMAVRQAATCCAAGPWHCGLALQLYFVARIALMAVVDPQSTTFQRSEAWRLAGGEAPGAWSQDWVDNERIAHT